MPRQFIFLVKFIMGKKVNKKFFIEIMNYFYSSVETIYDDTPRSLAEQSYTSFLKSFSQRIYFSYRKQFEPLIGSRNGDIITSDCGWGCMIRCAQMLFAQTLLIHMTNTVYSHYSNIQISDKCIAKKMYS
jgi:ABC-type proline/glycine betaine transport system substrate-binding protein